MILIANDSQNETILFENSDDLLQKLGLTSLNALQPDAHQVLLHVSLLPPPLCHFEHRNGFAGLQLLVGG